MYRPDKNRLREAHKLRWSNLLKWLSFLAAFGLLQGLLFLVFLRGPLWVAAPLVLLLSHLMHAHLLAFHEASHGTLCPDRRVNEAIGVLIGALAFTSLTLFRAVHRLHHVHLATERDEEMWPFVDPTTPRWLRRLMAALELTVGLLYTPCLLLRCFLRRGSPIADPAERRRIWAELTLTAMVWSAAAAVAFWSPTARLLLLSYLLPALIAADVQSLRKYIEHMGLTGAGVLGVTRSVVPPTAPGRLLAFSLFNEPYHGVHHKYPKLQGSQLPAFADALRPDAGEGPAPYPSYWHALGPMLRTLSDPHIGPQWAHVATERRVLQEVGKG
jgi:fatty acid desaturase